MNGGSGAARGSTAPVDAFKKQDSKVTRVKRIIVVSAVGSETPRKD